ncbi:alpha/beta hydrolase [Roseovarius sp. D22-M7]|uniref:alpha/beta hydrolase n=1 Tax=Roseovarius sp. D22-M7 TaxID=3127116 RepID=UPI00300FA0E5
MSLRRSVLNLALRLMEKPHLARARDPERLRDGFERKAKFWFRPPRGSRFEADGCSEMEVTWALGPGVACDSGPAILYFHGGGYVFGSPATHRAMLAHLSGLAGLPACLPAYGLAPEHPFPRAVEDGLAALAALRDHPGGVILGGDSAGGGLALAVLAETLRQGGRRPRGLFAFSPLTDLTFSGDSLRRNARADVMLPAHRAGEMAQLYLRGTDSRDPRASPLFAAFAGAGPVWLTASDSEILLDDTRRMTTRLRADGVEVTEVLRHELPHVWPMFHGLVPEADDTLRDLAAWLRSLSSRPDEN